MGPSMMFKVYDRRSHSSALTVKSTKTKKAARCSGLFLMVCGFPGILVYFKSCVDCRSRNLRRAALIECMRKEAPLVAGLMVQGVVLRALFVSGVQFQMHDSDYRYTKKTDTHNNFSNGGGYTFENSSIFFLISKGVK